MEPTLRPARPEELPSLSALALRSKAHWGYSAEFLESVRAELTLDDVAGVVVAETDEVVGLLRVIVDGESAELDMLFVDPPSIGTGVGRLLLDAALDLARSSGARVLGLDADPDAEAFYLRAGARLVGRSPSGSIPGRTLPRLEFDL